MGFSLHHLFHGIGKVSAAVNGAVLAPGASMFGGGGGGDRENKIDALYGAGRSAATLANAQSVATQRRSLGTTAAAYTGARSSLGAGRTAAVNAIGDAGAQAGANLQQSLVDRGLTNTTILDNGQQGISSGMSREIANVEASYQSMLGQLGVNEAAATTGIRQGIASTQNQLGQTQAQSYGQQANTIASLPSQDPNAWLDSLLGIGGTALGFAIGGPAGGAAGAAVAGGGGNGGGSSTLPVNPLFWNS